MIKTHPRRRATPRITPVAAAVSSLLLGALPALAQQSDANAGTQTIEVTGIRHAIESSINMKRNSDQILEAVTAEDIGKLPDVSIAESLARLPGVAAQRVDGRAQVMAIRGMSPDFSGTLLNGREQATVGLNRGVEFDQYPAELMSAAVVYKTPDATLLGQGVAGTVDLRAIRPLDVSGRRMSFNVRGEHNSQGALNGSYGNTSANGGRLSATYVEQFADRTLGVAVGVAHLDTPGQELHYKAWGFQDDSNCLAHTADWGCSPVQGLPAGAIYQNGFEVEAISRRDKRDGLMGVLEYKPSKDLHSTVDLYYSKFSQTEVMRGLMGSLGDAWNGNTGSTFSNVGTTNLGGLNLVTSATSTGGPAMVVRNDYNTRDDKLSSFGWNTEARIGDWKAVADLNYSNAKRDEVLFETYAGAAGATNLRFSLPTTSGFPTFTSGVNYGDSATVLLSDPAGWGHDGRKQHASQDDTIKSLNLHGKHDFEGILSRVDAGVNYTQRDKTRNFLVDFATLNGGGSTQAVASNLLMSPVSLGFAGLPSVLSYNVQGVESQYYTMTRNMSTGATGDYARDYGVHERIATGYAKADINTDLAQMPVTGNVGLQWVHTRQYSTANAFNGNSAPVGTISPGTSYSDFLPSLNLALDVSDSDKVRLGMARTLARPRIDDMNASSSASVATTGAPVWSGSGGNPKLQPWRANAYDLSFEHYLGKRSYVSAAVFYKKLLTYIFPQSIPYDFSGMLNTSGVTPLSNYGMYNTQANGTGGNMRGTEFSAALDGAFLSPSLDGFGAVVTASFTNSSIKVSGPGTLTPEWATLPGLSKTVAGLTLYYEKNGFSVRINDRYRSDFRGEYVSLFGSTSVYRTQAQSQVDFQTGYEFESGPVKGMSVLFQVINVGNAADRNVQDGTGFGGVSAPQEYNTYGRSFLFGVNYKL